LIFFFKKRRLRGVNNKDNVDVSADAQATGAFDLGVGSVSLKAEGHAGLYSD